MGDYPLGVGRRLVRAFLSRDLRDRADVLADKQGRGYDCFGANAAGSELALAATKPLYDRWFRVDSRGIENVPDEGATIIAANHSGTLPFDAFMLHADVLRYSSPPRLPRSVMDRFVPQLPFFGTLVARGGGISGSRRNVEHILETGQLLIVFPEGTVGIGKPFRDRYKLQEWRAGHAELSLRFRAPVVPTAIVGAEEQMPLLGRIDSLQLFGAPYLPIPITPFPLPVRYHVRYGEPIRLHEEFPGDPRDPTRIKAAAQRIKDAVQALIDQGLAEREGVFT